MDSNMMENLFQEDQKVFVFFKYIYTHFFAKDNDKCLQPDVKWCLERQLCTNVKIKEGCGQFLQGGLCGSCAKRCNHTLVEDVFLPWELCACSEAGCYARIEEEPVKKKQKVDEE
jgi:hypothetical protein